MGAWRTRVGEKFNEDKNDPCKSSQTQQSVVVRMALLAICSLDVLDVRHCAAWTATSGGREGRLDRCQSCW